MPRKVHKTHVRTKGTQEEKLREWISHLHNAALERVVFTEHKHDADVLKRLGIEHVEWHNDGEPDYKLVVRMFGKECILLFDADRPGNAKCEKVKALFEEHGIKTNTRFRKILFTTEFKELGGLLSYLRQRVILSSRREL